MADESSRLEAIVRGRVQGVGFRDFVYTRARSLGLTGYVRNARDDFRAVEVVAEGPRDVLERLVDRLWEGPRSARVDAVDVSWGEERGTFDRFDVTY